MTNTQQEMNCIKKVMEDKNPELLVRIDASLFGNEELKKIYILIKKFFTEHGQFMGWDVLRSDVSKRCKTADKASYLISLLEQIQERDISGLTDELLLADLSTTGKCRRVLNSIEDITRAAEEKDEEAVLALFREAYASLSVGEDYSLEDCDMTNMSGTKIKFNFLKTGLEPIDERGGLIEGGLIAIGGEPGEGKSTLAAQFCRHAYRHSDVGVAYFSYEQGKGELRARIMSAESEVDLGRIVSDTLSAEERLKLRVAEADFLLAPGQEGVVEFCKGTLGLSDEEHAQQLYSVYRKRDKPIYLLDESADWDLLFAKMELLHQTKGIRYFIVDYPYLVPRGSTDRQLQTWEYNLAMSKKLKQFARRIKGWVIVPAQYSAKEDSLKYVKGLLNDVDLLVALTADKDDKILGQANGSFKKYRNFMTIPEKPQLEDFKLQKEFHLSRFKYLAF